MIMILTLDEVKDFLKIEHNDEDTLIQGLIVAAGFGSSL